MAAEHGSTITRGFLFADLRGYTDFVERRGAAVGAQLLTRYRALARDEIARFGGAEIKTEGDSLRWAETALVGGVTSPNLAQVGGEPVGRPRTSVRATCKTTAVTTSPSSTGS